MNQKGITKSLNLLVTTLTLFIVNSSFASSDTSVQTLKDGNKRFVTGQLRSDGESQKDIQRLAKNQSPHSIILSCSDSRVPPELIFDQKLGELFTVRTAGESLSAAAIGSIEYAIEKLGTKNIVVLGHTNCGAVKAAVETLDGKSAGSKNLDELVSDIHPRIKSTVNRNSPSKDFRNESWANAKGVAKDLAARSPIIAKAIENGKVKIFVALYDLGNGSVEFQM